ncbi:hypothetical protein J2Z83_000996 [Virgibacillus natechei]|uniref:DUF2953 domain-containing protein n=1 Tax=Virgibacillus natechei TaxID=1216297 RepID=A0ABS4ID79_9BACI|nr:DUF2953 domain-containing protein [Virgibacillus natechei]MBP1968902.1 hypothetical protein [Virgibacillus natechei]UZD11695.1 DUF2953 domain-containing protein [Virgibacillus natechei]
MLWILVASVLIIIILIYSKVTISSIITYTPNEQFCLITVSFYRIRLYKKKMNITMENHDAKEIIKDVDFNSFQEVVREGLQLSRKVNPIINTMVQNTYVHKLKWQTSGGTGDASTTGIATGGVWGIKGVVIGVIAEKSNMKCKPIIQVKPHFQYKHFLSTFDCMISIRLGKAMYALLKMTRVLARKEKALI